MGNQDIVKEIKQSIGKVIVGKEDVIDLLLTTVLAKGHILLEDVPGTGKTMLAKTFAKSVKGKFQRIQFTPDLLPSDLTGINYYNQKLGDFVFRQGPIFGNIILADEINRATPRTQSSLLECMEERQATIDGDTREMANPFLVIATQNPIETGGTFRLPEAQLDRFMMKVSMGYPSIEQENQMVDRFLTEQPLDEIIPVCEAEDIIKMQDEVKQVYIHPVLRNYIIQIAHTVRDHQDIVIGISPRGTLTMVNAVRAYAYVQGRDYVVPEDIDVLIHPVYDHRVIIRMGAGNKKALLDRIVETIPVPTEKWSE